jgi:outer membrane biosynthesis protein TonB
VGAAAGEVVSARDEADPDAVLRAASRGDEAGIVTRSGGLQPLLPRRPTALVRRDRATSVAPRRGAHRRRQLPRRTRLLAAAVGAVVAAAGMSVVTLMSDHGAPAPTVNGQARADAPRLDVPMAHPFPSPDEAEQMVHPDQLAAPHRLAAATADGPHHAVAPPGRTGPTRSPDPTQARRPAQPEPAADADPTRDPEPVPDAEPPQDAAPRRDAEPQRDAAPRRDAEPQRDAAPAQDTGGTPPRKSDEAESRGNEDRDPGADGRAGGAGRRGEANSAAAAPNRPA